MGATTLRRDPANYTDDAELAALREQRFLERQARIIADTKMDPRLAELLLDRELWDTSRIFDEIGIRQQRVSIMRRHAREVEGPHPSSFPTKDKVKHRRYGVENDQVEAGRVREWAIASGRMIFDAETGTLVGREVEDEPLGLRHGRARRTPN